MALRIQKSGNQKPWTIEELKSGLESFYKDCGRYPTTPEIDSYKYLPSSRSIQRRFNGALGLREKLGLDGQHDFRSGEHSTERAKTINKRAHGTESEVYEYLVKRFGRQLVHREYFFTDDKRTRADFFVYDRNKGFCIDVFYPSSRANLIGCINSKFKKYHNNAYMRQYPVIFLQMNQSIEQNELDDIVRNKKNKLHEGESLMSLDSFKEFCKSRKPLNLVQ